MDGLKLYFRYIIIYLKTKMEYRFAFFTDLIVQAIVYIGIYISIWIIFNKFQTVKGWSFNEILFLYNLNMFTYSACSLFFWSPAHELEGMVQQGTLDSILIRPINPFLNLIYKGFNHGFLGSLLLGIIIFGICLGKMNVSWSFIKIAWLLIVILGGILIQAAIMIAFGSLSFWIVKSGAVINTAIYGFRRFLDYPISIYDRIVQVLVTFIIPYAFVNYYPSQYFLDKPSEVIFSPYFKYGTPIVGILLFSLSYLLWVWGLSKYQSSGS